MDSKVEVFKNERKPHKENFNVADKGKAGQILLALKNKMPSKPKTDGQVLKSCLLLLS